MQAVDVFFGAALALLGLALAVGYPAVGRAIKGRWRLAERAETSLDSRLLAIGIIASMGGALHLAGHGGVGKVILLLLLAVVPLDGLLPKRR